MGPAAKFLYLIASHTNADQIMRLILRITSESPRAQILLHHDFSQSDFPYETAAEIPHVYVVKSTASNRWGTFDFVQMVLDSMSLARRRGIDYHWLTFLSGQDYPARPIPEFERHVTTSDVDGFLEYVAALRPRGTVSEGLDENAHRYLYRYYNLPMIPKAVIEPISWRLNRTQDLIHLKVGRMGCRVGVRRSTVPFSDQFVCYRGSQWFTISKECVDYIDEFLHSNQSLVDYYRGAAFPDESFFQTILLNARIFRFANDNLVYRRIPKNESSPVILRAADYSALASSGRYFARKFDSRVDDSIMNLLDSRSLQSAVDDAN